MAQLIFELLKSYGLSGLSLVLLIALWHILKKKLITIETISEGDVMSRLKTLEDSKKNIVTAIQTLGDHKIDQQHMEKHCATTRLTYLPKDSTFKLFSTKDHTESVIDKVLIRLDFIADELKTMRADIKELWKQ